LNSGSLLVDPTGNGIRTGQLASSSEAGEWWAETSGYINGSFYEFAIRTSNDIPLSGFDGNPGQGDMSFLSMLHGFQTSDGVITDLSLTATSAVPEPSTWAMLLIGFGMLGFMAYRSGRKTARCG
jgi:PEP-CTERM motif